jgi:hypothetical protein
MRVYTRKVDFYLIYTLKTTRLYSVLVFPAKNNVDVENEGRGMRRIGACNLSLHRLKYTFLCALLV